MKTVIVLLITLLFNGHLYSIDKHNEPLEGNFPSPVFYIPLHYDIEEYEAYIDLSSYPSKYVSGYNVIRFKYFDFNKDNKFYFHLRGLSVDSIIFQNNSLNFEQIGTVDDSVYHYECILNDAVKPSDDIRIYYHGEMTEEYNHRSLKWGGVRYKDSVLYSMGVGFYNNYVSATQHWLPCLDLPFDKVKFKAHFIVPAGLVAVSNGLLKSVDNLDNGTDIYHWEHKYDCATYNLTFAVGPFDKVEMGYDSLPLVIYGKAGLKDNIEKSFKFLPKMIELYSKKFGDYPFEKVGYVLTPTGSMEHQTMISIAEKLFKYIPDTLNLTAAHELAHMWFGDCVTPYDFRDTWLNESFATYCEALWQEDFFDFRNYLGQLEFYGNYYISNNYGSKFEGIFPLYDYPREFPSSNYPVTIYYKGAVVLGMLRYKLGDSLFFGALKEYIKRRKYGNANTDSLKSIIENYSKVDLTDFFEQWVYREGWPKIQLNVEKDKTVCNITLRQNNPKSWGTFTDIPIEIGFVTTSNDTVYKIVNLNKSEEKFKLDMGEDFYIDKITVNEGPTVRSLIELISITTDVENYNEQQVRLYPNPSDSQIIINYPAKEGLTRVEIFNLNGKFIKSDILKSKEGENIYILYTNDLEQGSYYLILKNKLGVFKNYFKIIR